MRTLLLAHRYLGIALGLLMLTWCLSGIVMMYVPYPRLSEERRLNGLSPISWAGCYVPGRALPNAGGFDNFHIEMLAGRPVLRSEGAGSLDLITGAAIDGITAAQAAQVAGAFAAPSGGVRGVPAAHAEARLLATVRDDVWTVSGLTAAERPLYQFAISDEARTELYVSSVSGRAVQATSARQRFWSWFGAIPHWLYFARLRRHVRLWSAVVVYTSLAGCFLTMTGIAIGLLQLRVGGDRSSPHRGLRLWHHVAGLFFGLFTLTWVVSGLLSMNPWGLFESDGAWREQLRLRGPQPAAERVVAAVAALARAPIASGAVSVGSAPLAGRIYFIIETAAGDRIRVDEQGLVAPLTRADVAQAARDLAAGIRVASNELLRTEDAYFFGHGGAKARLPVYRIVLGDEGSTRYYVDPVSAEIEAKIDRNAKGYRWLHQGLHRLDMSSALRGRPAWDVLMIALLAGVFTVCATGTYLGFRRTFHRASVARMQRSPLNPRRGSPSGAR
jgi:hypothetical protein